MTVIRRGSVLRKWLKDRIGDTTVLGFPTAHHCAGIYARAAKGEPAGYYSANDIARAVINAGKRHRGHAPIGAARLWMDSAYGHIASVYNKADTKIICNDYHFSDGRINVMNRSSFSNLYDAGWCYPEDIPGWGPVAPGANGDHTKPPKPVVHVSKVQPGMINSEVKIVQKALHNEPKIRLDYSSGPGVFGPKTKEAYHRWERMLGYNKANSKPGKKSLTELGNRHGFRVES